MIFIVENHRICTNGSIPSCVIISALFNTYFDRSIRVKVPYEIGNIFLHQIGDVDFIRPLQTIFPL